MHGCGRVRRTHPPAAMSAETLVTFKVAGATTIGTTGHRIRPRRGNRSGSYNTSMKRRYSEIATIPITEQPATNPYGNSSPFDSALLQVLHHNYLAPMSTAAIRLLGASLVLFGVACLPGPIPSP